jgi:hypothetical protein
MLAILTASKSSTTGANPPNLLLVSRKRRFHCLSQVAQHGDSQFLRDSISEEQSKSAVFSSNKQRAECPGSFID